MRKFTSVLVANRGEIAVRVMTTARQLGYRVIAVYSEADVDAPHVTMADEAVLIGPAPAAESYLSIENILAAAKQSGAQAVHPGYGFLSENAKFARACEQAGLVFIGPSAEAIDLMGNKAAAKRQMIHAQVPCVPGYEGNNAQDEELLIASRKVGFPVMVKAAAGGGGRGMSLVESEEKLPAALLSARAVALNSFGNDELIIEKAVMRPRHVEVQVFADSQGNVIHLGERDCSVQRRHQKVVEEAPCPVMNKDLRAAMGKAAVEAAKAINYCGAGTVEFLLDADDEFYFLEMNTRLQVEHPVTELITGLDLVALQLQVAQGEALGISQADVQLNGHAIEVRLYAEDTTKGFLPRTGTVALWRSANAEGVRVDTGIATGQQITPFYDPMLAKIMAWGETREIARLRLIDALKNTLLFGTTSNRDFLISVLERDTFAQGLATTAFIGEEFSKADLKAVKVDFEQYAIAAILHYYHERQRALASAVNVSTALLNWSSNNSMASCYRYDDVALQVFPQHENVYQVRCAGQVFNIELVEIINERATLKVSGVQKRLFFMLPEESVLYLSIDGQSLHLRNQLAFSTQAGELETGGKVLAPMHGVVQEVFVSAGEKVKKGQRLGVVEAMKMQHEIHAGIDGVVQKSVVAEGKQVIASELLMEIV